MPQNTQQYYMVIDEQSMGPFTLDEIISNSSLTPETLVWKPGFDNWVAAKTMPELSQFFAAQFSSGPTQAPPYYGNQHNGGMNNENHGSYENNSYGPQNHYGEQEPNRFANNPQYRSDHSYDREQNYNREQNYDHRQNYGQHQRPYDNRYDNRYRNVNRTNWLAWAIVATVVGFFASCIGAIFGIIGIVQANKANNFYSQGLDREGDAANSNAKTMTIIGLVFAGIGIIASLWMIGFLGSLPYSYLY